MNGRSGFGPGRDVARAAVGTLMRKFTGGPGSYEELIAYLRKAAGLAEAPWCGRPECEAQVKDDSSATIRCLPLEDSVQPGACICCGRPAVTTAVWAQAY